MTALPSAPPGRVLDRAGSIWSPQCAPHHLIYAATGAGKSTLIKRLAGLRPDARLLLVEPKRQPDPVYEGFAQPVTEISPRFGGGGEGGGPCGRWFRLVGTPDRGATERRFRAALETVANEGHTLLVLDDTKEICKQLGLRDLVESILNLGRSQNICAVLSTTEISYVAGRSQGAMIWVGFTGKSLPAAKAGAELLGWRGRELQDLVGTLPRYTWIYSDGEAGSAGPVLTRTAAPAVAYEPLTLIARMLE